MKPILPVNQQAMRDRYPFAGLVRPIGGLIEQVSAMTEEIGTPTFQIGVTALDNLTMTFPHIATAAGTDVRNEPLGGAGADVSMELAWIRAVVEGAERYACSVYTEQDFITASAVELGSKAMDLERMPRCSEREYSDPRCPLRKPDPTLPLRWARGYSLVDRCERYTPAIMTHLYLSPWDAERFWHPISTGVAAHTSLPAALVSAICESIERDAIALTWLARLPLPRIVIDGALPDVLAPAYERLSRSMVQQYFFDATTDLGIPTVYSVQIVENHPTMAQYVNCATDLSAAAALAKTIREAAPARVALQFQSDSPEHVDDFMALHNGANYLGVPQQRHAFDFLLQSATYRSLASLTIDDPGDDWQRLRFLVDRLRALGMDAIAVDLTTDEVRDAGLWVVRVVIPDLLPMSPVQRARFLGHPRLYTYPEAAGFGKLTEAEINPQPQPFA